jgi:hypothetical protein
MHWTLVRLPLWNLIFVTHPLTSVVSISPGKAQHPPPPVLEISWILPKVLSFSPKSALAWCRRQVPVTPIQLPGCPSHQGNILTLVCAQSCPGRHGAFCRGPFSVLLSDSRPWVHCWPGMADLPTQRPQQLSSRTHLL